MPKKPHTLVLAMAPFEESALALGPLAARRAELPDEAVTVATNPGMCDLLKSLKLADDFWETGQGDAAAPEVVGAYRSAALFFRAAQTKFLHVVDLFPSVKTRALSVLASPGKKTGSAMKYMDAILKGRNAGVGLTDSVRSFALALGIDPDFAAPDLQVDPEGDVWIERALGSTGYQGGPIAVFHSNGAWPRDRFVEVAERLRGVFSVMPVVLDCPRTQQYARMIAGALGGNVLGVAAPQAGRFLAALARSSVVVTDDAGVASIANLLGAPSVHVAIGKAARVAERADHRVLGAQLPEGISADSVIDAAGTFVRRERTGSLFKRK